MHRAATWVTCANRLRAHTTRFDLELETYKRLQSDRSARYVSETAADVGR